MSPKKASLLVFLGLVLLILVIGFGGGRERLTSESLLAKFGECQRAGDNLSCLRTLANELMDKHSLKTISELISDVSDSDEIRDCHRFGHFVGNRLYRDTNSLKDSLGECGEFCFSGCYHGVAEEMFSKKLKTTGLVAKEDFETDLRNFNDHCGSLEENEQKSCYQNLSNSLHGLGHAFMFVTENELPESLKLCDLAGEPFSLEESCYDGVFMSNNETLTDPNHTSGYIKEGDILFPCDILDYRYQEFCYKSKSDYFLNDTPPKNIETCTQFPSEFQQYCFEQSARMISTRSFESQGLKDGCDLVPEKYQSSCVRGLMVLITGKFPETSKVALDFCDSYKGPEREMCLGHLGEQIDSRNWGEEFRKETCVLVSSPKPNWCDSVLKFRKSGSKP